MHLANESIERPLELHPFTKQRTQPSPLTSHLNKLRMQTISHTVDRRFVSCQAFDAYFWIEYRTVVRTPFVYTCTLSHLQSRMHIEEVALTFDHCPLETTNNNRSVTSFKPIKSALIQRRRLTRRHLQAISTVSSNSDHLNSHLVRKVFLNVSRDADELRSTHLGTCCC